MSDQKLKCGRCGEWEVEKSFSKNYPGCALPLGWFIFGCFATWIFPNFGFLVWPVFIILLVVGIMKQRKYNRLPYSYWKCKKCNTEYTRNHDTDTWE